MASCIRTPFMLVLHQSKRISDIKRIYPRCSYMYLCVPCHCNARLSLTRCVWEWRRCTQYNIPVELKGHQFVVAGCFIEVFPNASSSEANAQANRRQVSRRAPTTVSSASFSPGTHATYRRSGERSGSSSPTLAWPGRRSSARTIACLRATKSKLAARTKTRDGRSKTYNANGNAQGQVGDSRNGKR